MAAHKNLNEYQFRYRPTGAVKDEDEEWFTRQGQEVPTVYDHMVLAVHKPTKAVVGEMTWPNEGPLYGIAVDEDHGRKGIATNMVLHAQRVSRASKGAIPPPERATNETEDGEAWADAMESKRIPGWY
jgi:ribosomal protein S18 acetylase RimI-like enzyme